VEITDHFIVVKAWLFAVWLWVGRWREPWVFLLFTTDGGSSEILGGSSVLSIDIGQSKKEELSISYPSGSGSEGFYLGIERLC
jgi:hypothetical protein